MKNNIQNNKGAPFSCKKYYIIFLVATIVGWALVFGFPASFAIGAIGVGLGLGGFYSLFAVPRPKYSYSKPLTVKMDSGAEVKCTLLKMHLNFLSLFGVAFFFLKFLSPFYFIPLTTKYYILYNVDRSTDAEGKFEDGAFENLFEYLNGEMISRKRYKELMKNPQICKDELTQKLAKQREVFYQVADKFEKNNLLIRAECTDTYALYRLSDKVRKHILKNPEEDNLRVKFNFTGDNEHQKGFMVFENLLEQGLSLEKQTCFEELVESEEGDINVRYFELNNQLFYDLMVHKMNCDDSDAGFVDIDALEDTKEIDNRTLITEEIVCRAARKKKKYGWLLLCVLVYYIAFACVVGGVSACISLFVPGMLTGLGLTIVLVLLGNFLRKKAVPPKLKIDDVEIVKTYCAEKQIKNIDGKETVFYTMGNGLVVEDNGYNLKEKVVCYILYRKPENEIGWIYSSTEVKLSPDLKVIDCTK